MQIDFHHAATYVLARLAGFKHTEADIVAYSAQYVDDATNSGVIRFTNGALYRHISSAHKTADYRNFVDLANHVVWVPFHFLPGNGGLPAGQSPAGDFVERIICRPNSPVAQDMVEDCINHKHSAYALHRLGITMHVYADTWAHQGFAGINHKVNDISNLDDVDNPGSALVNRMKIFFGDLFDLKASKLVGDTLPLGHGAALSYPDRPYLKWQYVDHNNKTVEKDNTRIFMDACENMYQAMKRFLAGDAHAQVAGLPENDKNKIEHLLRTLQDENSKKRHLKWLQHIASGYFSFQPETLTYVEKGEGSWKHLALGTTKSKDDKFEKFEYSDAFMTSNWKLFHDALQAHRFHVLHQLLPSYSICAA
ncbi:MAG: hypothetical protein H6936_10295 [Burkholderiales bacterium]|nr:hypothetical protein [Nitrosomonas sp.]MCP5275219.1 hypothetical protein [Burkholderiales bacterium]